MILTNTLQILCHQVSVSAKNLFLWFKGKPDLLHFLMRTRTRIARVKDKVVRIVDSGGTSLESMRQALHHQERRVQNVSCPKLCVSTKGGLQSESCTHLVREVTQMLDVLRLDALFSLLPTLHFAFLHFLHRPSRSRRGHPFRSWRVIVCLSVLQQSTLTSTAFPSTAFPPTEPQLEATGHKQSLLSKIRIT
jgi:hypothetical protein